MSFLQQNNNEERYHFLQRKAARISLEAGQSDHFNSFFWYHESQFLRGVHSEQRQAAKIASAIEKEREEGER